mgnify:CR=1 FL=1
MLPWGQITMGRIIDMIRSHILEKYLSSYMRRKSVDALLILKDDSGWAVAGEKIFYYLELGNIGAYKCLRCTVFQWLALL